MIRRQQALQSRIVAPAVFLEGFRRHFQRSSTPLFSLLEWTVCDVEKFPVSTRIEVGNAGISWYFRREFVGDTPILINCQLSTMNKNAKIQRKKTDNPLPMQHKESTSKTMAPPPFALTSSPVQKKEEPQSGGANKLPESVRGKMESTIGTDFSGVNIHANSGKAVEAGALAYAQGSDIHFAPGQYDPNSKSGQELLAHELTHVQQQSEGRVKSTGQVSGMPLNDDKSLEKEADDMASKAAGADMSAAGTQKQLKKGTKGDADGTQKQLKKATASSTTAPVQRFKMRDSDIARYPKFAQFVSTDMPNNVNDPRLAYFLNKFGTNEGDTKRDIRSDLAWGSGPEIHPFSLPTNKVSFASNGGSEIIRLSRGDIEGYEKNDTYQQNFHRLSLESNILNGYTQFLDDQDGKDLWGKEGAMLEKAEFGHDINTVWDAKDARRCKFGQGQWEMQVVSAGGANAQRIRLWNSGDADGAYAATPGSTVSVKSRKGVDWSIRTQYLPNGAEGKKDSSWKWSEMLTNKVGKDEFMVRSEFTGDKDRTDLVLRVKRVGNA